MHENGAFYKPVETGTKKQMYNKQNQVLKFTSMFSNAFSSFHNSKIIVSNN
jgi:hypothetical protein